MTRLGVCYPAGFSAAGLAAGLKPSGKPDLALVANDSANPVSAYVTTSNRFPAAPVKALRELPGRHRITHVILNSGNANAATGNRGAEDVRKTVMALAHATGAPADTLAVCSTGVIGQYLPVETLIGAVNDLVEQLSPAGGLAAAEAIMTTDTTAKIYQHSPNGTWRIGGMAKGAGMIAPALATMLCVVTTDALVDQKTAREALQAAVAKTFNRTDTDGCLSTNDTVILMSSGASGHQPNPTDFATAVEAACADLAQQLRADAEGAAHTIDIVVTGATDEAAAEAVGRAVSRSLLVKTAIFGGDPNWGRILSQVGSVPASQAPFDPQDVTVAINNVTLYREGTLVEDAHCDLASCRHVVIEISLGAGPAGASIATTDLTHEYVSINSEYTT